MIQIDFKFNINEAIESHIIKGIGKQFIYEIREFTKDKKLFRVSCEEIDKEKLYELIAKEKLEIEEFNSADKVQLIVNSRKKVANESLLGVRQQNMEKI